MPETGGSAKTAVSNSLEVDTPVLGTGDRQDWG